MNIRKKLHIDQIPKAKRLGHWLITTILKKDDAEDVVNDDCGNHSNQRLDFLSLTSLPATWTSWTSLPATWTSRTSPPAPWMSRTLLSASWRSWTLLSAPQTSQTLPPAPWISLISLLALWMMGPSPPGLSIKIDIDRKVNFYNYFKDEQDC